MTPQYDEQTANQTTDGLVKAEPSPWTEPFQHAAENVWSDAAMQNANANHTAEAPMQANQHMDDQTRNALSKIFYGN
jgi:hypothetical protein